LLQAKRYHTLTALTGRNQLDSSYHVAFYLLSYDTELYEIACQYVNCDGIDFSGIKRATRGFDERSRQVIDIAHNLFSWNSKYNVTPFDVSRLGYPYMELVCNALYIAADEIRVVIEPDQNHKVQMTLDTEPYEKTKRIHSRLEQMQAALTVEAEAAKGYEMER